MSSVLIWAAALGLGSLSFAQLQQYRTSILPRQGETLAGPCAYQLTLPRPERIIRGLFVIFDRGEQVRSLYSDAAVVEFATRSDIGILLALHCPAQGSQDIDVVPENGIGRALLTALDQFGTAFRHAELSRVGLMYLNEKALIVPQFIIANGADTNVGTARPYAYFEQYLRAGAPFTFMIQNRTPHCCVANIVPIMLAWLADIVRLREPSVDGRLARINATRGWLGTLDVGQSGVKEEDPPVKVWNAVGAEISPATPADVSLSRGLEIPRRPEDKQVPASAKLLSAWLPSREFAQKWLAFSRMDKHPITPQR